MLLYNNTKSEKVRRLDFFIIKYFREWVQNLLLTLWEVKLMCLSLPPSTKNKTKQKKLNIAFSKNQLSETKDPKCQHDASGADLFSQAGWEHRQMKKGWGGCLDVPHNQKLVILTNRQADTQWCVTTVTQLAVHSFQGKQKKTKQRGNWEDPMHCKNVHLKKPLCLQWGLKPTQNLSAGADYYTCFKWWKWGFITICPPIVIVIFNHIRIEITLQS